VFGSFKVGSILGITIRVHVLLVLLVGMVVLSRSIDAGEALALVLLAIVLLLHELGHGLVARRFGIRVLDITLWPLGGMARMSEMPESSRVEGLIAAAGPAVNFVLAALALPVWALLSAFDVGLPLLPDLSGYFILINLVLGIFNLVPAFPTDGGRILRALLARNSDWVVATGRAVAVGRVFAVILGAVGIWFGNWMLPLVALWLWWMGSLELAGVRARHAHDGAHEGGGAAAEFAPAAAVPPIVPRRPRGHFTDDDIERLERYRGRLRPFDSGS
jgi:Zn-dependent protease